MKLKHIAMITVALILIFLVGSLVMTNELTNPAPLDWQPAGLSTAEPAPTTLPGWWSEMPTPNPLRTPDKTGDSAPTPTPADPQKGTD